MSPSCCKDFPSIFNGCDLLAAAPRDTERDMPGPIAAIVSIAGLITSVR